jgi:GTP-binding protein
MDQSDPLENYKTIRAELVAYDPNVAEQEELLVVTKCEMPDAVNVAEALRVATGIEPHLISAMTGEGVQKLLETIMDRVLQRRRALLELGIVVPSLRPSDEEQAQAPRPRRVPPHRAEATRYLSNEYQAKDADAPAQTIVPTEPRR